ncbi:MAG: hypothetical protein UZ20_WS6002000622 [candidate division WS6 bacterium OLB21]|uniref:Uncharacterized protein n=1 Tax=candidate division WS6 bacterium OLB21 TaxID=1617427 RepID=A0A136KIR8_9BACT|nr:MAG: hypothetical protein UZ20_WS6002000622 [candidate division WS6 bacterium OLB21]
MAGILEKQKLIITVAEAKKLLGKDYATKADEEIEKLIKEMSFLAKLLIEDGILFRLD